MRRLSVLALLLFPLAASAQFGIASIDDPIRPNRAPLAAAAEVPGVLLLGLGGPTATFVNPARGARADDRFVYGTIRPQNAPAAPVSLAGLFGTRDHRWLVTVDNSIRTRDDTATLMETRTDQTPSPSTSVFETEHTTESTSTVSDTRARLLLVGRTDFGGYAFGLYGGYRNATNDLVRTDAFFTDTETTDPPFTDTRRQRDDQTQRLHRDDVGVGAEVALAGRTWDLATAVSYQRRAADASLTEDTDLDRDFMNPSTTITEREQRSLTNAIEGTPETVDFEVIGALRAGLSRDDYLFGAVSGTFGGGTVDYSSEVSNSRRFIHEFNGEVVEDESFDTASEDAGDVDLDTRATRVSLGYVYARHGRRMTVLAAVNPTADFERVESAFTDPGNTLLTTEQETDRTRIALDLPLYVRFDVTKRLEAFGGGVYTYAYDRTEATERPLFPTDLLGDEQTLEITRDRTTDTFTSGSRLFAGAVMTFRSGLTAQASFRGNLAAINGWTVSLGYRF